MRLIKPVLIAAGLLVAAASAATPAMAGDGHGRKHWKHWKHHHYHHHVGPPRYLRAPMVVERPVIYRAVPDYGYAMPDYGYYGGYYGPTQPSLNITVPLR